MLYDKYLQEVKKDEQIKIEIKWLDDYNNLSTENYGFNHKSPEIRWSPVEYAASYAIAFIDYEATSASGVPFVHWYGLNVFEPQLLFDVSNKGHAIFYQGENSASSLFSNSVVESQHQLEKANNYYAPFPPNKKHRYELKVYALKNKISNNRDEPLFLDDFEKIVFEGGVLAQGVTYVNVPHLEVENNQLIVGYTQHEKPYLFASTEQTYQPIEEVEIFDLEKNVFYNDPSLFDELNQPTIKITDSNEETKSYAVVITSTYDFKNLGTPMVHFAHIVDKNTNERIKFNNSYYKNQKVKSYFNLNDDRYNNELLIIKNDFQSQDAMLTVHVYGLNKSVSELEVSEDKTLTGMYDTINSHVIGYLSKFIK